MTNYITLGLKKNEKDLVNWAWHLPNRSPSRLGFLLPLENVETLSLSFPWLDPKQGFPFLPSISNTSDIFYRCLPGGCILENSFLLHWRPSCSIMHFLYFQIWFKQHIKTFAWQSFLLWKKSLEVLDTVKGFVCSCLFFTKEVYEKMITHFSQATGPIVLVVMMATHHLWFSLCLTKKPFWSRQMDSFLQQHEMECL